jgi:tRNA dimethylallyltransferase
MKEIAILGPTASGKSALAIELAHKYNANILSLDSLAIYKETDIVSAKPSLSEREGIKHFGIDIFTIDTYFSAATFFNLYEEAKKISLSETKHLIIVGGTSFYLKSMIEGLSPKISLSKNKKAELDTRLHNLADSYLFLQKKDPAYANNIAPTDRYRIQKWYEIYLETGINATNFFAKNKRKPLLKNIPVFDIQIEREILKKRIKERTSQMLAKGLIDEIFYLERKYTRLPTPMKAIGIKETLAYLDGKFSLDQLHEQISTHTIQLAKRQETFNTSQFPERIKLLKNDLIKNISKYFN